MPSIRFEPAGTDAEWGFSLGGDAPPSVLDFGPSLGWEVKVSKSNEVRLTSGGTLDELRGAVSFAIGDATPEGRAAYDENKPPLWGTLSYNTPDENSSSYGVTPWNYDLRIHVSATLFTKLQALAAARTLPTILVDLGGDAMRDPNNPESADGVAIKFGWEPDGSALDWDNERHPYLEVIWCHFHVRAAPQKSPDEESEPDPNFMPPTKADVCEIPESVKLQTIRLEKIGRAIITPLWVAVALLVVLVFQR